MNSGVVIKTDKNAYFIKYSINAHCEAEDLLGFPLTQLGKDKVGLKTFRTLLYIGLKYGGRHYTMEQAGDIMEEIIIEKGVDYFSTQIIEAINKSMGLQSPAPDSVKKNS